MNWAPLELYAVSKVSGAGVTDLHAEGNELVCQAVRR